MTPAAATEVQREIIDPFTMVLCSALSVLSSGAAAFTEIDSVVAPTCSDTSTRTVWELNTRIAVSECVTKPVLLTVTS